MSFFLLEIHSGFPKRAKLSLSIGLSFSYLKQQKESDPYSHSISIAYTALTAFISSFSQAFSLPDIRPLPDIRIGLKAYPPWLRFMNPLS